MLEVSIWLSMSQGNFATFSPSLPLLSVANRIFAIGTIVMVTSFLAFFIVLLIILLTELILLILFLVYVDKVNENAKQDLKEGLLLYNTENNVGLQNAWDVIQAKGNWHLVLGESTA
uniref:Uncharacterized protein n=1 Tax=Chinchilla lanigera TaxID=34839 RepID=A0A8C2VT54_CHILA